MSDFFAGTFHCPACEQVIEALVERTERLKPIICEDCGGLAGPCIGAPMVLSASYPDGTNRGVGYDKLKEVARLRVDAADMPREKRGDIEREIKKLESTKPE
jgi:hypothetical protein